MTDNFTLQPDTNLFETVANGPIRVLAKVHYKYEPEYSVDIADAFEEMRRENKSPLEYSERRFRIIARPKVTGDQITLDLAPINYAFVALMKNAATPDPIRTKIQQLIHGIAQSLPNDLLSHDPYFNAYNLQIIGTETCIVTRDGITLLRRRGQQVLTGKQKWDVSVSGYAGSSDTTDSHLDFARTIQREAAREIGTINGNAQEIVYLGLHHNKANGATDLLAAWPIDNTAEELRKLISTGNSRTNEVFRTTAKTTEPQVWDTSNLLVDFSRTAILRSLEGLGVGMNDFMPEALACLELSLRLKGSVN